MQFRGWVEEGGRVLSRSEVESITPERLCRCGGEFVLVTDRFSARDRYGVMPGGISPGVILTGGGGVPILPQVPELGLEDAIREAVSLRCGDAAVVTLSGGVDSTLVAVLADLPCIAVGLAGSHDLAAAADVADRLGLDLTIREITPEEVEEAFPRVAAVLPGAGRMDLELGLVGYFIGETAVACGAERVVTGQAADELFGGYARYGRCQNLRADLDADFAGLVMQRARDSAAAGLSGVWYSMPYMDERVVAASRRFSAAELVSGDLRKVALRKVAERYLPEDLAWKPKKAMQYGSGMTAALRRMGK